MLKKVMIDGYKSIDHLELELKNFTLLAGVNSAGKSSAMQAILYLIQNEDGIVYDRFTELGMFADIRNSIKAERQIAFELESVYGVEEKCVRTHVLIDADDNPHINVSEDNENHGLYGVVYLPVERVGLLNAYELNTRNPKEIGRNAEYAYSYFAMFGQEPIPEEKFAYQPQQYGKSLNNQVNYWLGNLLGFHIKVDPVVNADLVIVTFANATSNRYYRGKNVGTGVTYISLLVIAALTCRVGDTLMIENPEIHLHPRAQSKFMQFLAFLAQRGLQIIIETHSDHIYNGLRKCVKQKELDNTQISIYYFELDETMQTNAVKIELNEQGAEINHPYGMFDQFDDDLDELLDF